MSWPILALLSAFFAGLTALLVKIGVTEAPSNLANLIRTVVIVFLTAAVVVVHGEFHQLGSLNRRDWTALILSGATTGISWLCYFAALKRGPISGVAPIDKLSFVVAMTLGFLVLSEPIKPLTLLGASLIIAGVLLTIPSIQEWLVR